MLNRYLILPALFAQGIAAQHIDMAGPLTGFVFDLPAKSFRPVIGSPGGAYLGRPIAGGFDFGSAAPASQHGIALVDGSCVAVSRLGAREPIIAPVIRDSDSVPDAVAWSRDGAVAVLYSRRDAWIQVIKGLPASASAGPLMQIPGAEFLSAVAVDEHGARIAIAVGGATPAVYEFTNASGLVPLFAAGHPSDVAFGKSLYVLDAVARRITAIREDQSTEDWPIVSLQDPIAIGVARDSNQDALYVAGRQDRMLLVYDPQVRAAAAAVPLPVAPTALLRLSGSVFVLGPRASDAEPLWSVAGPHYPAITFIPVPPVANGELAQ